MKKYQKESMKFIETEFMPEAVHNRCFCESGSREFVEFDSVVVEPLKSCMVNDNDDDDVEYYRAKLIINFSGEPNTFALIIKLLRSTDEENSGYDKFLNEEMFYSKMTTKYGLDIYPKCFVADMGRYGRPVIVLEDLETCGYVRVDSKLDEDHLALCLKAIARFHGRGLRLKAQNFNSFREFYAKLIDTRSDEESNDVFAKTLNSVSDVLKKIKRGNIKNFQTETGDEEPRTICHGNLVPRQHFFFRYENGKPVNVRIIGWNKMRYSSIAIDLAFILNGNIWNDDDFKKYLTVYIDAVNE